MATAVGKSIGNYAVLSELGSGGMGVVLLARQESLDRPAVLKRIRSDLSSDSELEERQHREARAAASIHHHNVVTVYDRFSWRGNVYIAQEYVDGLDLSGVLDRCGALPNRIAAMVMLEITRGLEEIHTRGIVHRDLKPQNILIGRRGEVKIADFGLALEARGSALTRPGIAIGSLSYMAPEQMLGERVDVRADIFSLGVVLYQIITQCLPYPEPEDEESESLLARMQRERYKGLRRRAPKAPRYLAKIVKGCLRAKSQKRIPSVVKIRKHLERALGTPSPADLRREVASWLWEHQAFETRENETVVQVVAAPESNRSRPLRRLAVAALVAAALLVSLWIRDGGLEDVSELSQQVLFLSEADPGMLRR
jgi:serine/threonine protein kinase